MSETRKPRHYLVNHSGIAIPFYPEEGEKNPDTKNQTHVVEVLPQAEGEIQDLWRETYYDKVDELTASESAWLSLRRLWLRHK